MNKYTEESLLSRFKEIHSNKYEYHLSSVKTKDEVDIFCKTHGKFKQKIKKHLEGQGCKRCAGVRSASKWKYPTGYRDENGNQVQYREYTIWRSMKQRVKPSYWLKHPHYKGTLISDKFSSWDFFKEWCDSQFNSKFVDEKGNHFELDKDILSRGVREYSENVCRFVPREVNVAYRNKVDYLPDLAEKWKDSLTEDIYNKLSK